MQSALLEELLLGRPVPREAVARDLDAVVRAYAALAPVSASHHSPGSEEHPARPKRASVAHQRSAQHYASFLDALGVFVRAHPVEQPNLLWKFVMDLVPSYPRGPALYGFACALLAACYSSLGPVLRREVFRFLVADENNAHLGHQVEVLAVLTSNGRDIGPMEIELGDTLAAWLTNRFDEAVHEEMRRLLELLIRALRVTPHFLSVENKTLILQRACVVANSLQLASQLPLVGTCLALFEVFVELDIALPPYSLMPIVACVCRTVNIDSLCDKSWNVARGLLGSAAYGLDTLQSLCSLLTKQSGRGSHASMGSVLRGAVFFVGMSCWGKDRVESLYCSPAVVLPALCKAVKCGHAVVAYEVLLSLRRLVRKQGASLCVEWDTIFDMLAHMTLYTQMPVSAVSSTFVRVLVDTLLAVKAQADSNVFLDDKTRVWALLEHFSELLPSAQSLGLLSQRLQHLSVAMDTVSITHCLRNHLVRDQRGEPRVAALAEVQRWLLHTQAGGEHAPGAVVTAVDDARAALLLPVWADALLSMLSAVPAGQERSSLVAVVQTVAKNVADTAALSRLQTHRQCVELLFVAMSPPRVVRGPQPMVGRSGSKAQLTATAAAVDPDAELASVALKLGQLQKRHPLFGKAVDEAACDGLVTLFLAEVSAGRGRRARGVFHRLVSLVTHPLSTVRHRVLVLMESLRADAQGALVVAGNVTDVRIGLQAPPQRKSSTGSPRHETATPSWLDFRDAVETLALQLQSEPSKQLHAALVATLYEWLLNGFIVRGVPLDKAVSLVCQRMLSGQLPKCFRETSTASSAADQAELHNEARAHTKMIYQVATLFIGYGSQCADPMAMAKELLGAFVLALTVPPSHFDRTGQSSLQRIALNALCMLATHYPTVAAASAPVIVSGILAQRDNLLLAPHLPRVLAYLSYCPAFVAALNVAAHHVPVMEYLADLSVWTAAGSRVPDVAPAPPQASMTSVVSLDGVSPALSSMRRAHVGHRPTTQQPMQAPTDAVASKLFACAQWLLCVEPVHRPTCYRHMLPSLLKALAGPHSLAVQAYLDLLSNHAFLHCVPSRDPPAAASDRFCFAKRDALLYIQGNVVMEVVSGENAWILVTMRRPSGTVQWVLRMQNDLLAVLTPSLYAQRQPPALRTYPVLQRAPVVAALERVAAASSSDEDEYADGDFAAASIPFISSTRKHSDPQPRSHASPHSPSPLASAAASTLTPPVSELRVLAGRRARADTLGQPGPLVPVPLETSADSDVPPLQPTNALLDSGSSPLEPRSLTGSRSSAGAWEAVLALAASEALPVSGAEEEEAAALLLESSESEGLRMGSLFSYEDEAPEEERDAFFAAHSLDGSHAATSDVLVAASWTSPESASPPLHRHRQLGEPATLPLRPERAGQLSIVSPRQSRLGHEEGASVAPQRARSTTLASPSLARRRAENPPPATHRPSSLDKTRVPSTTRTSPSNFATLASESGKVLSGMTATPLVSSQTKEDEPHIGLGTQGNDNDAPCAPHSALLFLQLRYIPFCDDTPIRIASGNSAVQRALSLLDLVQPCVTSKMAVLYVGPGQHTEEEVLNNTHGSVEYTAFLRQLGDMVRLRSFQGYAGGLDTAQDNNGRFSVCFRTHLVQVMFHVATLMPRGEDGDVLNKKRLIGNDNVHFVWNESGRDYDPSTLRGEFNFVQLLITPLGGELARISVYRKREMGHFTPMSMNQVVDLASLAPIALHTANNADRDVFAMLGGGGDGQGITERLRKIRRVRELAEAASRDKSKA